VQLRAYIATQVELRVTTTLGAPVTRCTRDARAVSATWMHAIMSMATARICTMAQGDARTSIETSALLLGGSVLRNRARTASEVMWKQSVRVEVSGEQSQQSAGQPRSRLCVESKVNSSAFVAQPRSRLCVWRARAWGSKRDFSKKDEEPSVCPWHHWPAVYEATTR
jgi:hypothetical protein